MPQKILQIGAEAVIIQEGENVIKRRLKKSYRISEIDEKIRKLRTRSEAKLLEKASKIINIPQIIKVDENKKEIVLEFINGKKLSENLDKFSLKKQKEICRIIGKNIAKLHNSNIIHGDLTTSNMIFVENSENKLQIKLDKMEKANIEDTFVSKKRGDKISSGRVEVIDSSGQEDSFGRCGRWVDKKNFGRVDGKDYSSFKIFFIDFGLGFISHKIEDKAVDIHLLKQALEAKHFKNWRPLFELVIEGYRNYPEHKKVLEQLKKVEQRGRYKEKY